MSARTQTGTLKFKRASIDQLRALGLRLKPAIYDPISKQLMVFKYPPIQDYVQLIEFPNTVQQHTTIDATKRFLH